MVHYRIEPARGYRIIYVPVIPGPWPPPLRPGLLEQCATSNDVHRAYCRWEAEAKRLGAEGDLFILEPSGDILRGDILRPAGAPLVLDVVEAGGR